MGEYLLRGGRGGREICKIGQTRRRMRRHGEAWKFICELLAAFASGLFGEVGGFKFLRLGAIYPSESKRVLAGVLVIVYRKFDSRVPLEERVTSALGLAKLRCATW